MDSFIAFNPYPSYKEMLNKIEKHPDTSISIAMWCEYGKPHHMLLKEVYESGMNKEIIRKAGEAIYKLGGMRAMQMNYYAFMHCSPFRHSENENIVFAYKDLEYGWDGIGDWVS